MKQYDTRCIINHIRVALTVSDSNMPLCTGVNAVDCCSTDSSFNPGSNRYLANTGGKSQRNEPIIGKGDGRRQMEEGIVRKADGNRQQKNNIVAKARGRSQKEESIALYADCRRYKEEGFTPGTDGKTQRNKHIALNTGRKMPEKERR